jgi:hypothetical protein
LFLLIQIYGTWNAASFSSCIHIIFTGLPLTFQNAKVVLSADDTNMLNMPLPPEKPNVLFIKLWRSFSHGFI